MEDDARSAPTTLAPAGSRPAEGSQRSRSASLLDKVLQWVQQHSYSVCDAYLRLRGIHDDLPPSITVVIPAPQETAGLSRTIESLLSARYIGLYISLVGTRAAPKLIDNLSGAPNIQFLEMQPEASAAQAIRSVLLEATSPIVAWLKPGDTLPPPAIRSLGEIFRQYRRVGCVLVPEPAAISNGLLPGSRLDFTFLSDHDLSSSVKIFVRRELFWGATRTFAGTEYDLNDWAVALNTARFSNVRLLAGGFYESATTEIRPTGESQEIKSTINAQMWWFERLRQRFFGGFHQPGFWRAEEGTRAELGSSNRSDTAAPPAFIESLAGLNTGQNIELIRRYRWSFADQPPMARSIFLDQANELLIFQQLTEGEQDQNGPAVAELTVSPEKDQRSRAIAHGVTNLLKGLPGPLREEFGADVSASLFPIAAPDPIDPPPPAPGGISRSVVAQPMTLAPSTNPFRPTIDRNDHNLRQREDFQIATLEQLFDFVLIERPLNVSLSPHVCLRAAANRLEWEGWLIFVCTVFDVRTVRVGWTESAMMIEPEQKLAFSRKSLGNLLCLAGFTPRHVLGLTDSQVEDFGSKITGRTEQLRHLVGRLFQADASSDAEEKYLLLACQRTF